MILVAALMMQAGAGVVPRPSWPTLPGVETRKVAIDPVADCLQVNARKDVDRLLTTALLGDEERDAAKKLLVNHLSCVDRPLAFSTPISTLRGALAQRRLASSQIKLNEFASRKPRMIGRVPQIDGRPFLVAYAACLVVAQPEWTVALLRSPGRTEAERRQFMQFGDSLTGCMPEGRDYRVDVPALRDEMAAIVDLMIAHGDGA